VLAATSDDELIRNAVVGERRRAAIRWLQREVDAASVDVGIVEQPGRNVAARAA